MDKKTFHLLEYIAAVPCRSYDELEAFNGASLENSLEYQRLFIEGVVYNSTDIFRPADNISRLSATPHGHEVIENYYRERRRDWIAYATFAIVLTTFLMKLLGYF
jgi:hypothetical protein